MKKLIALFTLITLSISAFSQQKDLCVRGGFNIAKHRGDVYAKNEAKYGVNLGFTYDIELIDNLYFRPGIFFTMKGTRDQIYDKIWHKRSLNQNYIDFPLLVAYKIDINSTCDIDIHAGPYCAIGFCGHNKLSTDDFKQRTFQRHNDEDNGFYRRLDIGINLGAGVDISRFYIGAAYELGFLKVKNFKDRVIKPNCLMFNVGYYL